MAAEEAATAAKKLEQPKPLTHLSGQSPSAWYPIAMLSSNKQHWNGSSRQIRFVCSFLLALCRFQRLLTSSTTQNSRIMLRLLRRHWPLDRGDVARSVDSARSYFGLHGAQ
ncbi:hypothetical protein B0H19DRAFT_1111923 [Mycena capillaripes]|nr:hypothetical protein B0H19DRAFT_1111923 [Mycena capillaripes]